MGIDILVKLASTINNGSQQEVNQFETDGKLYLKDDEIYLRYKESIDLGNTWTTIKWNPKQLDTVKIIRQGDIRAEQIFQKEFVHNTFYYNPHGRFAMKTITRDIHIGGNNQQGNIKLVYQLFLNEQNVGEFSININFSEIAN